MKVELCLALLGALCVAVFANCPIVVTRTCVNDDDPDRCTAVEVCEDPEPEPCGDTTCEYPNTCASPSNPECDDLENMQLQCSQRSVCKPVSSSCGSGVCGQQQDCVMQRVCRQEPSSGRRLQQKSSSKRHRGGPAVSPFDTRDCPFCRRLKEVVCEEVFQCVAKQACQEIDTRRCLSSSLQPGADVAPGGYEFEWTRNSNGRCGETRCSDGTRCANVAVQRCESTQCGETQCGPGTACVTEDDECRELPLLETQCRNVTTPTCVPLSAAARARYNPPCTTEFRCDDQEGAVCGDKVCQPRESCVVEEKRDCDSDFEAPEDVPLVENPRRETEDRVEFPRRPTNRRNSTEGFPEASGDDEPDDDGTESSPETPGDDEPDDDGTESSPETPGDDEPDDDGTESSPETTRGGDLDDALRDAERMSSGRFNITSGRARRPDSMFSGGRKLMGANQ